MDVRFSITIRQRASLRDLIEYQRRTGLPFPTGWTAPPMSPRRYTPFQTKPDAAPVRLIVRRVKPTPGSAARPLRQIQLSRLHHVDGETLAGCRSSPPHRGRERHTRPQVPCQRQVGPGDGRNLARWTARIGLGQQIVTTKTLRRRVSAHGHPLASRCKPFHSRPDGQPATDPTSPSPRSRESPAASSRHPVPHRNSRIGP